MSNTENNVLSPRKRYSIIGGVVLSICLLGAGGYFLFADRQVPVIRLLSSPAAEAEGQEKSAQEEHSKALGVIGPHKGLTVQIEDPSGIKAAAVELGSGALHVPLTSVLPDGNKKIEARFTLKDPQGIPDGPATIRITATDASGNTAQRTWSLILDTQAPLLAVHSTMHNLNRGGTTLIRYSAQEEIQQTGVQAGEYFFPGYKQPSGDYLCLFALPEAMDVAAFIPRLLAQDMAGNEQIQSFVYHVNNRSFPHDIMHISDRFLQNIMPQFEADFPQATNQLDRFLLVNNELRRQNRVQMATLSSQSTATMLWQGAFSRLPGAASRASFGDRRTYRYKGKDIDKQIHHGIDLASVKQAPVPAANTGQVVFAGVLGIYGKSVVLDHGLGLMTLYAHMSQIDVNTGDRVAKNTPLGRTGASGLAGGDHLHFAVWLSGVPVQPLEWWDRRWIAHNITDKLVAP